jgi:DNA/RNA endonuclease YhcR with UshA esterase domain
MVVAVFGFILPAGATPGTIVSIGSTTSDACDTVSITIDTDITAGIGAATIVLTYDPAVIHLNSVSGGPLGTVTWNDNSGTVTMTVAHATECPTGSNIKFADLEFCAVADGASALDIEVTTIADCNANSITPDAVNDGQFIVSGAQPIATTVSIGSITSSTCDTVPIMISTDDADGIGAVTIVLTYDTAVVSLNSVSGDALGDVTWNDNGGTVTMTAAHATECPTGSNIKFADLEFCAVADGASALDIDVSTLADCNANPITPDAVNDGQFIVSGAQPTATTVSIGSITSSTCDTVPITISTDDADGIGAATIVLTYDTAVVSLNSVSGGALGDVTWNDNGGTVTMTAAHATECPTGSNIKFADLEFCPVADSGASDLDIEVITLADCDANSITPNVNDGQFSIGAPLPSGLNLYSGWNFVSVPYELDNSSVDYVLADINYSVLVYYNASNKVCDDVLDLEPLKGYWIENPEEFTQVIREELLVPKATPPVPATLTVYEGWNAIGYTDSVDILPAEVAFDPVTGSYEQVGWNGQTGIISGKHVGTDVFGMGPYEAFWVFVTQEDMLSAV